MNQHPCPLCQQLTPVDLSIACPSCGSQLALKRNRTNRNQFVACMGFPNCRWAMSISKFLIYQADLSAVRRHYIKGASSASAHRGPLRKITIDPTPDLEPENETVS